MAHTHSEQFASFADFYPYYLNEHQNATSRRLHFIGSLGVIGCRDGGRDRSLAVAAGGRRVRLRLAWIGHFFFEKNALPRSGIRSTA
jgi:hypothetical protein